MEHTHPNTRTAPTVDAEVLPPSGVRCSPPAGDVTVIPRRPGGVPFFAHPCFWILVGALGAAGVYYLVTSNKRRD